jgi:hypothetical protein
MGARARVCPRCGRGSLFHELLWIAVLGVLLLGIGVLTGVVPMNRIPRLSQWQPTAQTGTNNPKISPPAHKVPGIRRTHKTVVGEKTRQPDSTVGYSPCSNPDTSPRTYASAGPHSGPHAHALTPCLGVSDSVQTKGMPSAADPAMAPP